MDKQQQRVFLTLDVIFMCWIIVFNISSIVVIIRKSKLRNPKNYLLICLAFSDLCIGVFVIPNVVFLSLHNSPVSALVCQMCMYSEFMAKVAHACSIVALAIDRFIAIQFPMKSKQLRTQRNYMFVVGAITVFSLLYGIRGPTLYRQTEKVIPSQNNGNNTVVKYLCKVTDDVIPIHLGFLIVDFLVLFLLPAIVLIISNTAVSRTLSKKAITRTGKIPPPLLATRKKAMRLLLIMVAIFIILNFPLWYYRMAMDIFKQNIPNSAIVKHSFLLLVFFYNCSNVFFYGMLNSELRMMLFKIFNACGLCQDVDMLRRSSFMSHCSSSNTSLYNISRRNTNSSLRQMTVIVENT
ncbi:neuropeptide FF receptor 2-like [Saccostrea cucullata]|uniref:neuropeptide FF receptor 2-like n=1 Tax=Saccostrea cuccullata TaxID=36930 RepID=UPI002ED3FCB2